jgi:tetratricopeptide (TPR) repeat protein
VADPEVRANVTARAAETAHRHGVCDEIVGSLLTRARSPRYPPWAYPVIHRAALSQSRRGRHDIARPQIVHALDAHRDRTDCGRALRLAEAAVPTPDCPHLAERNLAELVRYAETAELRVRAADQLVLRCSTGFVRGVLARAHSRSDIADEERWAIQALYWALRPDSVPVHLDEPLVSALPRLPADAARAGIVALATAVRGGPRTLARVRALARLALGPEGDRGATVAARLFACRALLLTEATDEAEAALSALLTESRTQESATLQAATQIALAELEGRRGRVGRAAVALNAAACALPDWAWQNRLFSLGVAAPAHLALLRGDFELAARCLAEAPSIASEPCWPWWDHDYLRGCHALVTGRWRESAKLLRRCGRRLAARGCLNPAVVPWRSMAALALAASGEIESARELARREVHLAREWSAPGALGWALVVLGALEGSGAAASTDEGIGLLRLSPLRSDLALGLTLIAVMARDAAPNALWEAAKLCDEIGALPGAARLRDLARASHGG